jgi:DNA-directed RNA polymerase specialized sigma24 family protein
VSTEAEAIAALQSGDSQGLETLVRLHQLRAMRIAFGVTWQREAAEDAVAEAFVKVYQRIGQLDPVRPFSPWFTRIGPLLVFLVTIGATMVEY